MTFEEFTLDVKKNLEIDGNRYEFHETENSRGEKYLGIHVIAVNTAVPNHNLDAAYRQYLDGREIKDIVHEMQQYKAKSADALLMVFDNPVIAMRRMMMKLHDKRLRQIPDDIVIHWITENLYGTYHVDVTETFNKADTGDRNACVCVTKTLADKWQMTEDDLYHVVIENLKKKTTAEPMADVMRAFGVTVPDSEIKMFVVRTSDMYGAAGILVPEIQDYLQDQLGKEFVIIPSSIHEMICIPKDNGLAMDLAMMITGINDDIVEDPDVLSNNPFMFAESRCHRCGKVVYKIQEMVE
mgnify:CR=1 FL=1